MLSSRLKSCREEKYPHRTHLVLNKKDSLLVQYWAQLKFTSSLLYRAEGR
jgi:hypothetical protein